MDSARSGSTEVGSDTLWPKYLLRSTDEPVSVSVVGAIDSWLMPSFAMASFVIWTESGGAGYDVRRLSRSCRKLTTRTFAGCHSGSRTIDALVDHARSCGDSVPAVVRLRDEGAVSQ